MDRTAGRRIGIGIVTRKEPNLLSRLLTPERVVVAPGARDKWEAIRQLVDVFVDTGDYDSVERQRILNAVYDRERKMSTGLERGVAIPHGVYDGVPTERAVLGVFRGGIDFQSRDGKPSDFVMMLLYPPEARQEHVQNLSDIVRTFSSESFCDQLRGTDDPDDLFARLAGDDGRSS